MVEEIAEGQRGADRPDKEIKLFLETREAVESLDREAREALGIAFAGVPEARFYSQRGIGDMDPRAGLGAFKTFEVSTVTVPVANRDGEVLAITAGDGPTRFRALTEESSRTVLGEQIEAPATQPGTNINQDERLRRLFNAFTFRSYLGGSLVIAGERIDPRFGETQRDQHSILVLPIGRETAPKRSQSMANIAVAENGGVEVTIATQVPNQSFFGWRTV